MALYRIGVLELIERVSIVEIDNRRIYSGITNIIPSFSIYGLLVTTYKYVYNTIIQEELKNQDVEELKKRLEELGDMIFEIIQKNDDIFNIKQSII